MSTHEGRAQHETWHQEIRPLDAATRAAIVALAARAEAADGVAPLSEQPLLDLSNDDPDLTHVVVRAEGSDVIGYTQVDRRGTVPSAELVVDPESRRGGIGTRLLRTAQRDATLPSRSGQAGQHAPLRVWAHGFIAAAQGFTAAAGMGVVRELLRLDRPLDDPDESASKTASPPPRVRNFRTGSDEAAFLDLNARAFAHHPEQGRLTLKDLEARFAEPWFDPALFLLAPSPTPDAPLKGFVWLKREPGSDVGEIYVLAVAPEAQGRGLGGELTTIGLATLRAAGCTTATLWVDADNEPAVRAYRRAGFEVAVRDVQVAVQSAAPTTPGATTATALGTGSAAPSSPGVSP